MAKIQKASMDGSSITVLHNSGLKTPTGITLDYESQTLYWIDAGMERIEMSKVDGTGRTVLKTVNIALNNGIAFFEGKLYWSTSNQILYTSVNSPNNVTVILNTNSVYKLKVVSPLRQPHQGTISV